MRPIIARVFASAIAMAWVASGPALAADKTDPLAPTGRWSANQDGQAALPPMGWNSWNAFNSDVDEEKVMASARLIVDKGLREAGYRYINIDDGWWLRRRQPDGRLVIRADKFPSAAGPNQQTSFRPLTDRLHAMGFKAGIYSDIGRNSCGQVYTPNFANQPEGTVAEREVGLYGHIDQDIALYFREWGFDYIKVDGCGIRGLGKDSDHVRKGDYRELTPLIDMNSLARTNIPAVRSLYDQVAAALKRENPDGDYLFSLCLWGSSDVRSWGKQIGNVSRTSDDITAHWSRMLTNLDTSASRALYAHPHTWNDPDMLFVGSGEFDANHMTEARSHFAMWAMMNAPLLIGFDLRKANAEQLALLGNRAIIALNQDAGANQAVPAYLSNDVQIFVKSLANGDKAVAILNRTAAPVQPVLTADHLKLRGDVSMTDLWTGATSRFSGETKLTLAPHQTLIYRVTGAHRLADGHYLSEAPSDVNPAEDGIVTPEGDPTIHHELSPWGGSKGPGDFPQYAGWGGAQADRTPFGRPLRLSGKVYDTGIGVLANSRLEVRNRGQARFSAMVGIDDSATARERRVVFEVYGDGKLLTRSRAVALNEAPVAVEADVRGRKLVELIARADSAPEAPLPVVWADARLTG
ncbi:NPCBM/NEW2 domain-containing protein [Sphingomonas sp. Leaf257]|uniref:NPCBM/NEW2 domain-containing protein n=1 Tax=Sphingomonas sp. Leaf257 TaxID=1736309 RepID=UPI0006F6E968|nr:NPCBM/NEW2 domain-containing protein [Sphingomonas sp. Leaf257]KQO50484.1 alpha-galactosidase [Sphingomonas sp. Leaf257]